MGKTIQLYRILISSPSDLAEERAIVEEVIFEVNPQVQKQLSIMFDPIRWETNAVPGLSMHGAQGVIDEQTPGDYEIYLGILGARFGSPTERAFSGTEHEFESAYGRWQKDPKSVRIMFYFKNSVSKLSDFNPDQLKSVLAFKTRLGDIGLYRDFSDSSQFREILKNDLFSLGSQLVGYTKLQPESQLEIQIDEVSAIQDDIEDLGFIDLLENGAQDFDQAVAIMNNITEVTNNLGSDLRKGTQEIKEANEKKQGPKQIKEIINRVADSMDGYAVSIKERSPKLSGFMENALINYGKSITLMLDFGGEHASQIINAHNATQKIIESIGRAYEKIFQFRHVIADSPRATTKYNRSKRATIEVLDQFMVELIKISETASNTLNTIDSLGKPSSIISKSAFTEAYESNKEAWKRLADE